MRSYLLYVIRRSQLLRFPHQCNKWTLGKVSLGGLLRWISVSRQFVQSDLIGFEPVSDLLFGGEREHLQLIYNRFCLKTRLTVSITASCGSSAERQSKKKPHTSDHPPCTVASSFWAPGCVAYVRTWLHFALMCVCCILEEVNEDCNSPEGHAGWNEESWCVTFLAGPILDAARFLARFKGAVALPLQSWSAFDATIRDMT